VDGAEAGGGEGGEDAGVVGDVVGGALAAAESGGDQVEGVAAVGLGAGRAAGGAAVVAADEEMAGGQPVGGHPVQDGADLARGGVEGVFRAVAVETDRVGAAAETGELADKTREGAESGQGAEFGQRGRGCAGDDGAPSRAEVRGGWLPGRRMLGGIGAAPAVRWSGQRRRGGARSERRTRATTATETAAATAPAATPRVGAARRPGTVAG
jgi:hypothetical protein